MRLNRGLITCLEWTDWRPIGSIWSEQAADPVGLVQKPWCAEVGDCPNQRGGNSGGFNYVNTGVMNSHLPVVQGPSLSDGCSQEFWQKGVGQSALQCREDRLCSARKTDCAVQGRQIVQCKEDRLCSAGKTDCAVQGRQIVQCREDRLCSWGKTDCAVQGN